MKTSLILLFSLFIGGSSFGQTLWTENFESYQGFGDNLVGGWTSGQFKVYVRNLTTATTTKLCEVNINQFHKSDSVTTPVFGPINGAASFKFQSRLCAYTGSFPTLGYVPGVGDKMVAYLSSDNGLTFQLLQDLTGSYTQMGNAFTDFTIPITGHDGQSIKVKFKVVRGTTGTEWYTDFDNFEVSTITAQQALKTTPNYSLIPNPSLGYAEVYAPEFSNQAVVEVFNVLGTKIFQIPLLSNRVKIDLSATGPGIYIVKVSEGKMTVVKRLIVK